MAYSEANPPVRAGDYSRFLVKPTVSTPPGVGGIVAVIDTDDWGPLKTPTLVTSFADYLKQFGQPLDPANPSALYVSVYNAFRGESDDYPGASAVLIYRIAASAAAKASKALQASSSGVLTLTAKYEGARGNNYRLEVVANAADSANKRDVNIYDGTLLIDSYKGYGAADITKLATDINARSQVLVAGAGTNGTKLDLLAATALTGGVSGTSPVSGDYTAALTSLEPQQFAYLAPTTTDDSIKTAIATWAADLNNREKSKRFFVAFGGAAGETFTTASASAAGFNNENIVRVGTGTYRDTRLGLNLSTAQLAPRIAGIMAARGGGKSLTFAELQDLTIVAGPSEADLLSGLTQGVVQIGLGTGGVPRIEKGVTTYITTTDPNKPFSTYSKVKYVTTMQSFERDNRTANETKRKIGVLNVNKDTREDLVADAQKRLNEDYIATGQVQPGAYVQVAQVPAPSDDDEFVKLEWYGKFSRSLEQVRNDFYLS